MKRATGYLPPPPHVAARNALLGARSIASRLGIGAPPPSADLRPDLPPVFDQEQTGSCTGQALAAACYAACSAAGRPLAWVPSPAAIYTLERCIERASNGGPSTGPLTDSGANPATGVLVVSGWGIKPISPPTPDADGTWFDAALANLTAEPTLGDLEAEGQTLAVTSHPIGSTGAQLVVDLQSAISAGCPVIFGGPGGADAFQSYSGGVLGVVQGDVDHCLCLVGYDGSTFVGRNSWGPSWGLSGYFQCDIGFLSCCTDFFAVSARS